MTGPIFDTHAHYSSRISLTKPAVLPQPVPGSIRSCMDSSRRMLLA